MRSNKIYSIKFSSILYISVNYSHHVVHHIPSTYLTCQWQLVPFDHLYLWSTFTTIHPPLVTTRLIPFSMSMDWSFVLRLCI